MGRPTRRASATLSLLALLIALLLPASPVAAEPTATPGVIDLSQYDFAKQGPASLNGAWAFYWGGLLAPDAVPTQPPADFMMVPGSWNGAQIAGQSLPADGFATYHLRVRVADPDRSYGLAIRYMSTAYRLWVDGELLATNGQVGTSPASSRPQFLPLTVHFTPKSAVIDLVVQVSNFDHRLGGVWNEVRFGPSEQMAAATAHSISLAGVVIGAILMIGLYHLILYSLNRRERTYLWFAILCLNVALMLSVQGEMLLPRLLAGMPLELQLRLEYLSSYAAAWLMFRFLYDVFKLERLGWLLKALSFVWGALALFTLLAPIRYSSLAVLVAEVAMPVWLGIGVWLGARSVRQGHRAGRPFLWGFAFFLVAVVNDFLIHNGLLHTPRLMPYGQIGLILIQSAALAVRYAATLREQAEMAIVNATLYQRARTHLEELQETRRLVTAREDDLHREIAEMLHGRVQTKLLLAAHRLEQAERLRESDPAQAKALVQGALQQIDSVREEEIRQTSHALHPSVIRVGLLPAVRSVIARMSEHLQVTLAVDPAVLPLDDSLQGVLTEAQRLALYRALEEGLANVIAHAGVDHAHVTLDLPAEGQLRLSVLDKGRGVTTKTAQNGLGLPSIGARIEQLGGTWRLESDGRQGTTLTVTLPVAPVATEE